MEKEETYRFRFEDEQGWRQHLDEKGFVIIAEWIPRADCQEYVQ